VGPDQVAKSREMHWMRIDSYYEGELDNPKVVHQPMLCQHCDSAPCETVCPVNATNHSPDGLNQMAYNRCVGTRYCANNCPYKVRRFNFLEFTADKIEPASFVYNPEVTVRPRGVIEKCTFCVQRIQDVKIRAKGENRPVKDGEVQPACAAACPSRAIVFGDLKDPKSEVSRLVTSTRGYKVLEEVGTRPSITYLADLKNPALEGGAHA
jgi:molybdopterin-containing oxidoreductase family iron-sulfur binding subunit